MDIKIEQVNKYDITIDGKKHTCFTKDSEWEGMIKFKGLNGELIVDANSSGFESIFSQIFGNNKVTNKDAEFKVVKISQNLIPEKEAT